MGLSEKPEVDKLELRDLRVTSATSLAKAGKDMKFIAQFLGHRNVTTSARYVHYSDEGLRKGAEALAGVTTVFTTPHILPLGARSQVIEITSKRL